MNKKLHKRYDYTSLRICICDLVKFHLSIVDIVSNKDYLFMSAKGMAKFTSDADQILKDLSIIIGASWVALNQTCGLIEVHFPKRGRRERG